MALFHDPLDLFFQLGSSSICEQRIFLSYRKNNNVQLILFLHKIWLLLCMLLPRLFLLVQLPRMAHDESVLIALIVAYEVILWTYVTSFIVILQVIKLGINVLLNHHQFHIQLL